MISRSLVAPLKFRPGTLAIGSTLLPKNIPIKEPDGARREVIPGKLLKPESSNSALLAPSGPMLGDCPKRPIAPVAVIANACPALRGISICGGEFNGTEVSHPPLRDPSGWPATRISEIAGMTTGLPDRAGTGAIATVALNEPVS